MTLATHIIIGGLAASFFPTHPEVGFVAAFASHFALDTIPHWDYSLHSAVSDTENPMNDDIILDKRFIKDLANISIDIIMGVILASLILVFLNKFSWPILIAGALGGIVPDALQFIYMKFRHEPLTSLQKFHMWIQKDGRLKSKPFLGLLLQIAIVIIITALAYKFS